jgi:exopolyphosphatase/guanosine-5'-triphosphate,3'-diphosphate pyrophosphatase
MRTAIIDIGSNAVRSVVYSDNSIGAHEVYHERFKVDLGTLFTESDINIKHPFYAIISRFLDIFHKLSVVEIKCVATAVLRQSPKAEEFCKLLYSKYNINVEIISGEQEAFLSSYGLLMGSPNPYGIIADLGGGSLEIAQVQSRKITHLKSLPLGTQVLSKIQDVSLDYVIQQIRSVYENPEKSRLHLIGGGFRVIAREYIKHANYPLYNLHNLEINIADLSRYLQYLQENYRDIFSLNRKHDRFAIIVLQSLIEVFNPDTILISNYGLKEGVRFTSLPQEERYKDIIFERCRVFVNYQDNSIDLDGYTRVIQNVLKAQESYLYEMNDIIRLSLIFINFKKNIDRNFIAHFLSHTILMSDIPFTHKQRASIALILFNAFAIRAGKHVEHIGQIVLDKHEYKMACIIAKLINILLVLDGPELSSKCSIDIVTDQDEKLLIKTCQTLPYTLFNHITRQLKSITKIQGYSNE